MTSKNKNQKQEIKRNLPESLNCRTVLRLGSGKKKESSEQRHHLRGCCRVQ